MAALLFSGLRSGKVPLLLSVVGIVEFVGDRLEKGV